MFAKKHYGPLSLNEFLWVRGHSIPRGMPPGFSKPEDTSGYLTPVLARADRPGTDGYTIMSVFFTEHYCRGRHAIGSSFLPRSPHALLRLGE